MMRIIRTIPEMQEASLQLRREGKLIGFVPTMGFLHEGHLSLMRIAREKSDALVTSIFVNPTQFGPGEDLGAYPRDLPGDEALCEREGVDIIFYPSQEEVYAPDHTVYVVEDDLSNALCGLSRPVHFRGVLTVVAKLFHIVLPDLAVFGKKDTQQFRLIEQMVRDLNFPIRVLSGPIIREPDGLAMSSRNKYLSPTEREDATSLYAALQEVESLYADGERDAGVLQQSIRQRIGQTSSRRIDYVEVVDYQTLKPVQEIQREVLVALAVFFGNARLIDNTLLHSPPNTTL